MIATHAFDVEGNGLTAIIAVIVAAAMIVVATTMTFIVTMEKESIGKENDEQDAAADGEE